MTEEDEAHFLISQWFELMINQQQPQGKKTLFVAFRNALRGCKGRSKETIITKSVKNEQAVVLRNGTTKQQAWLTSCHIEFLVYIFLWYPQCFIHLFSQDEIQDNLVHLFVSVVFSNIETNLSSQRIFRVIIFHLLTKEFTVLPVLRSKTPMARVMTCIFNTTSNQQILISKIKPIVDAVDAQANYLAIAEAILTALVDTRFPVIVSLLIEELWLHCPAGCEYNIIYTQFFLRFVNPFLVSRYYHAKNVLNAARFLQRLASDSNDDVEKSSKCTDLGRVLVFNVLLSDGVTKLSKSDMDEQMYRAALHIEIDRCLLNEETENMQFEMSLSAVSALRGALKSCLNVFDDTRTHELLNALQHYQSLFGRNLESFLHNKLAPGEVVCVKPRWYFVRPSPHNSQQEFEQPNSRQDIKERLITIRRMLDSK